MCTSTTNSMPVTLETRHQYYVVDPKRRRPRSVRHVWADCTLNDFLMVFLNFRIFYHVVIEGVFTLL